jgi:hypothetical protein
MGKPSITFPTAMSIHHAIARDPIKPSPKGRSAVFRKRPRHLDESFLSHLFGIRRIQAQPISKGMNHRIMAVEQCRKCGTIAVHGSGKEQVFIGGLDRHFVVSE